MTALLKDVRLGDVLDIRDGTHGTPKYVERGIPLITSKNLTESGLCFREISYISQQDHEEISKRSAVAEGDILYGMIGTIGKPTIVETSIKFSIKNVALFKSSNPEIDNRYLLNLLKSNVISAQIIQASRGGTQKFVSLGALRGLKATFPPLPQQRRISAILDKADALRAMRREAIAKLDQLLQSVFLEMYGDPVANPKGWLKLPLEDICERPDDIKCGPFGTQLAKSEFTTEGVPLWGIKNVNAMFKRPTDEFVSEKTAERLLAFSLRPGDIVMTRKGTVGNCAIYPQEFPLGIMHSDLLRLRVSETLCIPSFVSHQLHESRDIKYQLSLISGGAIMPGINVGKLKKLQVFVPPLADQRKFATVVENIERQKIYLQAHSVKLDDLFYSLQQLAFAGEL